MWHKELWIIDNGASFYFHHSWQNFDTAAKTPFKYVKDHVLLPQASMLDEANQFAKEKLNDDIFREIVNLIPEDWLHWNDTDETPEEIREVYFQFLKTRLENSEIFVNEAKMQEDKIYEYAVIRLVPKVEREEFFNIGLVMFSKKNTFA